MEKRTYEHLLRSGGYLWERRDGREASPEPHVILPISGIHSTGYFWSPVDNPELMQTIAWELYDTLYAVGVSSDKVDVIIGPERETAPLVTLLTLLMQERGRSAKHQIRMTLTKDCSTDGRRGLQTITEQCFTPFLANGARVLVIANAVATGTTAVQTVKAVERYAEESGIRIEVLPNIGCIVNRLGRQLISPRRQGTIIDQGFKLAPYLNKSFSDWQPSECPLCAQGSPAVDPRRDWKALTP